VLLEDVRMTWRFATGLFRFLREPLTETLSRRLLQEQLHNRNESFLRLVERGIFGNPRSPYLPLLRHAGMDASGVRSLVGRNGLEGALEHLFDAGVRVRLEEFKGRRPIRVAGEEHPVGAGDFDNPLLARHYEARTGGSRGVGTRLIVDLDLLTHEAAYELFFQRDLKVEDAAIAVWRPVPPGAAGMKNVLRYAKMGRPAARWFSQQPLSLRAEARQALFTLTALCTSRLARRPLAVPTYVPIDQAAQVALWAVEQKRQGRRAFVDTNSACGVRVCLAAEREGLDMSGICFRLGSEPFSHGKARVFERNGCRAVSHYSMAEVGRIGIACANPEEPDEVHIAHDKLALVEKATTHGSEGASIAALFLTTIHPATPKIMLNVETGDYGTMGARDCGCRLQALGFDRHLHTIRSYEKLTSEGMNAFGADLVGLIEEVLPARFGGDATDYQFVEEEENGLPRVGLVVSPRVGPLDETRVISAVLEALRGTGDNAAGRLTASSWRAGGTLRVERREPCQTGVGKILPLHVTSRARGEDHSAAARRRETTQ
jgi:hypothetical protein